MTNVNVRISGELHHHLLQQLSEQGLYENASEYIRDLVRKDLQAKKQAWGWLAAELAPAMRADASEFKAVSADEVIARNKKRRKKP